MHTKLPVAIIGGGPVGLAAAAQLAVREEPFVLFESGDAVGTNFSDYGHVRLFSPWKYNKDEAARTLLTRHNHPLPDDDTLPFGQDIVNDYLLPLANLPEMKKGIHLMSHVEAITRKGFDKGKTHGRESAPFLLEVMENGKPVTYEARAVIDATGTWQQPNPVGSDGVAASGEEELREHIRYGIPDVSGRERSRYEGKRVMVVGSGHSAINALLELSGLEGTTVHWSLRKQNVEETYGGMEDDALPGRGALGTRIKELVDSGRVLVHEDFHVTALYSSAGRMDVWSRQDSVVEGIDEIIAVTGSRPDFSFLREVRHSFDAAIESVPAIADLIDPNLHSCGTVRAHGEEELRQPEKDFYIVGAKSYGRAPTFLLATGYEQVRSIVAYMTGDFTAAKEVKLNLPETGVCQADIQVTRKASCCQ
ncbi:NAD(P)-binding domain-containing protein [Salimicrobium sp. PL1-032A]|uniref:NAD(P)-binding domain-containing protein n=1 Tax=Salimicrobium sp. PL1-032A TaxID=3095364 RepID=UPI003260D845